MASLPLDKEILRAVYDLISLTRPFLSWNLPDSDDITFVVVKDRKAFGWYRYENNRHTIGISKTTVMRMQILVETMAHEMIHLHQNHSGMETWSEHNEAFKKLAQRVCKVHGYHHETF